MSWLLITATPVLLMLTAAGLARVEAGLDAHADNVMTRGPQPAQPVNPQFHGTRHDNRV